MDNTVFVQIIKPLRDFEQLDVELCQELLNCESRTSIPIGLQFELVFARTVAHSSFVGQGDYASLQFPSMDRRERTREMQDRPQFLRLLGHFRGAC